MHRTLSASGFRQAWHIRRAWWACPANRTIHTTWADLTFFHYHKPLDINELWWLNDFISRTKTIRMIELEWLMLQSTEKKSRTFLFFSVILIQVLPDLAPSSAKSCTKFCKILHQVLPPLFRSKWSRLRWSSQEASSDTASSCIDCCSCLHEIINTKFLLPLFLHVRSREATHTFTWGFMNVHAGRHVRSRIGKRTKQIFHANSFFSTFSDFNTGKSGKCKR